MITLFDLEMRPSISFSIVHEYYQVRLQYKDFRYVHFLYL